jgi:hypothetical protein
MEVIRNIEAKVKELLDQKNNHQLLISRLSSDLETAKSVVHKIEGALEAFSATNANLKEVLGVTQAVAGAVDTATSVVDAASAVAAVATPDASSAVSAPVASTAINQ